MVFLSVPQTTKEMCVRKGVALGWGVEYSCVMKAKIIVTPRREVLDPQGEAVRHGLHSLGYEEVSAVRVGRYVEVDLAGAPETVEARVQEMCQQLLANEVIEDFSFTLGE
jgi:phosphoribosylformylglycinamidine synthase